jgi:hypothetical protein
MRAFLVFCFVVVVFQPAAAVDKIKIEIVESVTKTQMIDVTIPDTPEQAEAKCTGNVVANSIDCKSTVTPATQPTSGKRPMFKFFANAIFPDGSHVLLLCLPVIDKA